MRFFIGIHTQQEDGYTKAAAIATEIADKIPSKYARKTKEELEKLLLAHAVVYNKDERVAVKAAIQRLYEKLFIVGSITNPDMGSPPVTLVLPKKHENLDLNQRVLYTNKHWVINLAGKVLE